MSRYRRSAARKNDVARQRYRCDRVRQNNGMMEFFFTCVEGHEDQVQYVLINIIAEPDEYKVGEIYWWSKPEPAFPHR